VSPGPGWYCVDASVMEAPLCFGSAPCLSDGVSRAYYYQGSRGSSLGQCRSSIPSYCGDDRRCISVGTGDDLASRAAIGCLLEGVSELTDRVVICETVGYCDDGAELEWCADIPAMYPIPYAGEDTIRWYRLGSWELGYQVRSDYVPQADPLPFVDMHDVCRSNGATRYCGATPCGGAPTGDFDCGNGTFVDPSLACNGRDDCGNGRDETASMCSSPAGCCAASRGCPSETGSSCGSTCCCCPSGQRCCADWSGCCAV
jgi:hypothetical protein